MKFWTTIRQDLIAGLVVFFVALPLCLGIAFASGAPLISGIISGIIGGVVVGWLSKSQTSVSGPAAGLSTLVAAQIQELGSLETFLLAVIVAGIVQIVLGIVKAGALSAFFPSAVIKGLLAAIGVILILKQIPHLLGHDNDPEGDFAFVQKDHENTFSEIFKLFRGDFHDGALIVGLISLVFLIAWDRIPKLKKSLVPSSLMVVLLGLVLAEILRGGREVCNRPIPLGRCSHRIGLGGISQLFSYARLVADSQFQCLSRWCDHCDCGFARNAIESRSRRQTRPDETSLPS